LKQVFNNREMSNKTSDINIQDLNSFNVAFRNTKGNICGLINIRKLNTKDRVQIIASDQVMEHLYLLENKLPNIDLVVYQKGAPSSYAYHIKSGYKVPFAWDFPLKPKEIVVSPVNPALRFGENTFNFHENIRTSMKDEKMNTIGIEAVLEFVPSANLMLSFRCYNNQRKEQEAENLQINDKGKNIEIFHKWHPSNDKLYIQFQKVSISVISNFNRKRNETHKILLNNLQICKEDLGVNNLWNLYIKDFGLYKYQHKEHELIRLEQFGNQNPEILSLSVILIAEKKIGDIVFFVVFFL